jgi:hypothetical protein
MQLASGYSNTGYNYTQQPPSLSVSVGFQSATYVHPPADPNQAWPYPTAPSDRGSGLPALVLPSIHSFGRDASPAAGMETGELWQTQNPTREDTVMSYRTWHNDALCHTDNSPTQTAFGSPPVDPSPTGSQSSNSDARESPWLAHQTRYAEESFAAGSTSTQVDGSVYPSPYPQQPPQTSYQPGGYVHVTPSTQVPSPSTSSSRQSYTRTLVGPLSSNACRLLDEHRKPGIFFLFQDLSVRTEGTFRLRLRLMNVGAPPAPEFGAAGVHDRVSPVLAQAFTETFTVYSAKRFPGVPGQLRHSISRN